jgi:hypothetical protein
LRQSPLAGVLDFLLRKSAFPAKRALALAAQQAVANATDAFGAPPSTQPDAGAPRLNRSQAGSNDFDRPTAGGKSLDQLTRGLENPATSIAGREPNQIPFLRNT